jgi:hypothetical protein
MAPRENTEVLCSLLDNLQKDMRSVNKSVQEVAVIASGTRAEVGAISKTLEGQDRDIHTLFKNQNGLRACLNEHNVEIAKMKKSSSHISGNPSRTWLFQLAPWLAIAGALLLGMAIVGALIGDKVFAADQVKVREQLRDQIKALPDTDN